jgi:hypothetical protein
MADAMPLGVLPINTRLIHRFLHTECSQKNYPCVTPNLDARLKVQTKKKMALPPRSLALSEEPEDLANVPGRHWSGKDLRTCLTRPNSRIPNSLKKP